ncbi:glutamine-hydrolyzing carbamoyl-phosphate synthase small subunit [Alkalilimnicola ehrlichii]|uniref:glutamine-hydrolyzing carbamoyl-phosphate synthase small subunit n=1 Tax=Alkalilimnicola ehrlichii TaxID=351052 RepID=UPI00384F8DC8
MGVEGMTTGEVCFNTAMTGYQEICTDPSYSGQLVTLTYPHIGNVGVNPVDAESKRVMLSGLVVRDVPPRMSSWRAAQSLPDYLRENAVVAIAGIDTRKLTRLLREKGAQNGCIMAGGIDEQKALAAAREFPGLKGMDLAQTVTCADTYVWRTPSWKLDHGFEPAPDKAYQGSPYHVVVYDYGVKRDILRRLCDHNCQVTVVPAKLPAADVLALKPDGVLVSNGPGDPEPCDYAIAAIQELVEQGVPLFGICLGHQLLGLASGAKSTKMKFGHHGANHPVLDLDTRKVIISSQNHGFAIDEESLPKNVRATHRSLFDGSLQGIERTDKPAFSFQGHPEASPGPNDVAPLFTRFIEMMAKHRQ